MLDIRLYTSTKKRWRKGEGRKYPAHHINIQQIVLYNLSPWINSIIIEYDVVHDKTSSRDWFQIPSMVWFNYDLWPMPLTFYEFKGGKQASFTTYSQIGIDLFIMLDIFHELLQLQGYIYPYHNILVSFPTIWLLWHLVSYTFVSGVWTPLDNIHFLLTKKFK